MKKSTQNMSNNKSNQETISFTERERERERLQKYHVVSKSIRIGNISNMDMATSLKYICFLVSNCCN